MKILYISPKIPYPLYDGGKLRAFNQIKHLSKTFEIKSLSFIDSTIELEKINELKKYCSIETIKWSKYRALLNCFFGMFLKQPLRVSLFKNKKFRKKAFKLTKESDFVIIQTLRMTQYCFKPDKTIVDIVDTPSLLTKRILKQTRLISRIFWTLELSNIKRFEKWLCKRVNTILVSSKDDLKSLGKGILVKHGTSIKNFERIDPPGNNLMFLGNLEYPPNIDAVLYFINQIFPLVKTTIEDAKFYVVGIIPKKMKLYSYKKIPKKYKNQVDKGIIFTNYVKNLEDYFSKCKVFVAPLRMGSGLQFKILDALNYEIPIVTTSIVNQGIEAEENKEILIANSSEEFAKYVIKLLKSEELRKKLSTNGKKFLEKNYTWDNVLKQLDKILEKRLINH